ncbi:MAG: glycosyltransferase family 4 protein [Ignisphaera sp.]
MSELIRFLRMLTPFEIEVIYFPHKIRYVGPLMSMINAFLRSLRIDLRKDIVHSNNGVACLVNSPKKIETYHHIHTLEKKLGNVLYENLHILSCKNSQKIIVPSLYTKVLLSQLIPRMNNKIIVIPNGVDTSFFKPFPEELKREIRASYKVPEDRICILYIGRMERHKGQLEIIKLWFTIDERLRKRLHIFLVGRGQLENKILMMSRKHNIPLTHLKYVPDGELVKIYNMADIYVSLSSVEGFGLSVLEAMACGLPIVAWNTGAISQLINGNGFLTRVGDIQGVKKFIELLIYDDKLRRTLSLESRRRSMIFDWKTIIRKYYIRLYEEINET